MSDSETDDGHGQTSSMRVTLRWARRWGAVLIVAAILALAAAVALKYGDLIPAGITLASLGAGLPSVIGGAKAWQAQAEAKTEERQARGRVTPPRDAAPEGEL